MDQTIVPKISIQMCTYNRVTYLPEAIQSVLDQTFTEWELIILDDASTDNTEEMVKSYLHDQRIRYIKHSSNLGLGENRVQGMLHVRGTYVAILDSDDRWSDPSKLERQNDFLDTHPECGVVGTFAHVIDKDGNTNGRFIFETNNIKMRSKMLLRSQFVNSSTLFRKAALDKVGTYNALLAPAEDYDLFLRIGKCYQYANIPAYMTDYRIHLSNSSGSQKIKHAHLHLEIIKKFKHDYPHYVLALIKAYLRIAKAFLHL